MVQSFERMDCSSPFWGLFRGRGRPITGQYHVQQGLGPNPKQPDYHKSSTLNPHSIRSSDLGFKVQGLG